MGYVTAARWNATKAALNNLISNCNSVIVTSYTGTISPAISLAAPQSIVGREIKPGDRIKAAEYSDGDGLVTKYNFMRAYDSCRYRDKAAIWHYSQTIVSTNLIGRRDHYFSDTVPAYIPPPQVGDTITDITTGKDILDIITAGSTVHRNTILSVGSGNEYVVIDNCHSNCHSNCHGRCNRSRR